MAKNIKKFRKVCGTRITDAIAHTYITVNDNNLINAINMYFDDVMNGVQLEAQIDDKQYELRILTKKLKKFYKVVGNDVQEGVAKAYIRHHGYDVIEAANAYFDDAHRGVQFEPDSEASDYEDSDHDDSDDSDTKSVISRFTRRTRRRKKKKRKKISKTEIKKRVEGENLGPDSGFRATERFFHNEVSPCIKRNKCFLVSTLLLITFLSAVSATFALLPSEDLPVFFDETENYGVVLNIAREFEFTAVDPDEVSTPSINTNCVEGFDGTTCEQEACPGAIGEDVYCNGPTHGTCCFPSVNDGYCEGKNNYECGCAPGYEEPDCANLKEVAAETIVEDEDCSLCDAIEEWKQALADQLGIDPEQIIVDECICEGLITSQPTKLPTFSPIFGGGRRLESINDDEEENNNNNLLETSNNNNNNININNNFNTIEDNQRRRLAYTTISFTIQPSNSLEYSDQTEFVENIDTGSTVGNAVVTTSIPTAAPSTSNPTHSPTPPTIAPTLAPTPDSTPEPTRLPTISPSKSSSPSKSPSSSAPSNSPVFSPTAHPTVVPTKLPTVVPTKLPTRAPTDSPLTSNPTKLPSTAPTTSPTTSNPSYAPTTSIPTRSPTTSNPSYAPTTSTPTDFPTAAPSKNGDTPGPTNVPTVIPTQAPTDSPITSAPSTSPLTSSPSMSPTVSPITSSPTTTAPTMTPTMTPTSAPTTSPTTTAPTTSPTISPSTSPTTSSPTISPSTSPTQSPVTSSPTLSPSTLPTQAPTDLPTIMPSASPLTSAPSLSPSVVPSNAPTDLPTTMPSTSPLTSAPSLSPSTVPSGAPTNIPTLAPSTSPITSSPITSNPSLSPTLTPTLSPTTSSPVTSSPTPNPTVYCIPENTADSTSRICECKDGYKGAACSELSCPGYTIEDEDLECSGPLQGECVSGVCDCKINFGGDDCSEKVEAQISDDEAILLTNVFGIAGLDRSLASTDYPQGLPVYDESFDPTSAEGQRGLLAACAAYCDENPTNANDKCGSQHPFKSHLNTGSNFESKYFGEDFLRLTNEVKDDLKIRYLEQCAWAFFVEWGESTFESFPFPQDKVYQYLDSFVKYSDIGEQIERAGLLAREGGIEETDERRRLELRNLTKSEIRERVLQDTTSTFPKLLWIKFTVQTGYEEAMGSSEAHEVYLKFEEYNRLVNENLPEEVAVLQQTSSTWARAETEVAAISGTISAGLVSIGCAFVAIFIFTGNAVIALVTTLAIISIVSCLLGFMLIVMGWKFGAIEAISVTVFVGFSVDFCLHLANSYRESESKTRYLKTKDSLTQTGVSVLSAALTTAGASIFLFFCKIVAFRQFGVVICANTSFSIVFAIFFFAPLLMMFGPENNCGDFHFLFKKANEKTAKRVKSIKSRKSIRRKKTNSNASNDNNNVEDAPIVSATV